MKQTEPVIIDPTVFSAGIHQYVAITLPSGSNGLAKIIGWADAIGRPTNRGAAVYVVVEGDYSAAEYWNTPLLLKLPETASV
jgi:hypothetical protein